MNLGSLQSGFVALIAVTMTPTMHEVHHRASQHSFATHLMDPGVDVRIINVIGTREAGYDRALHACRDNLLRTIESPLDRLMIV